MRAHELHGDVLQVGHRLDIDPAIRHRDDHVGAAEAERAQELDGAVGVGERLADQVLAGDAEMHAAGLELVHDLRRREIHDLDAVEAFDQRRDSRALVRHVSKRQPRLVEESRRRHPSGGPWPARRWRAWKQSSARSLGRGEQSLGVDGGADRRHLALGAERGEQPVIAPAAGDRACSIAAGLDLKHHAGIIFEVAAEAGGEARAAQVDAALRQLLETPR